MSERGLAALVVDKRRLVIALWVVLLLLLLPASLRFDEALSYSEEEFLPSGVEGVEASRILEGGSHGITRPT